MHISASLVSSFLLLAAGAAEAATSWSFDQGRLAVVSKAGPDGAKEKFDSKTPLMKQVPFGSSDTVKISLTAKNNGKAKRPHQAFVVLKEVESGLEAPFPLTVKENGEGSVEISQKDLPVQFLLATKSLRASIIVASFGSAEGLNTPVFNLEVIPDSNAPAPSYEQPLRYGKRPEIHHTFGSDPSSPPKVVSSFFALAVLGTMPALFIGWLLLGANLSHLSKAAAQAPLSHAAFFGSIIAMEFVFFLYYSTWNLFQVLPLLGLVGAVAIVSGPKALGEVQSRRLAGER